jgi:hypothetical protein
MDGSRFDAWTRRRFHLLAGGGLAALLGALPSGETEAKNKKRRKRRPSKKRRCRQKANRIWCDGTCVQGECCPDTACGGDPDCSCTRTIEGQTACMNTGVILLCVGGCASSAECAAGAACLPLSSPCGDVTALCFPRCGTLP